MSQMALPLDLEQGLAAGVDEAGRGCLAGPVVAAAVILPPQYDLPGLNDSKKMTQAARERLYPMVREQAVAWGIGLAWPAEIDRVNILQATFLAMGRAVRSLRSVPGNLLVDGNKTVPAHALPFSLPQKAVVGGDGLIPCISAASVLAKTYRDKLMVALARRYPLYDFEKHYGYGTKAHMAAVAEHGPCRMHRLTFRGAGGEKDKKQPVQVGLPLG